jgi:hypothetical protein
MPEIRIDDKHERYIHLLDRVKGLEPIPTAVAHPCDQESLKGPVMAFQAGIIEPILVGPENKIRAVAEEFGIDLHGMTVEKARETLWEFLGEAVRLEVRCVRVTHGKAVRLDGKRPMIKSHVNTWLRQHSQVLGFCSCQAKHGGAGAVYVMLKRTMMEGRDE